MSQTKKLFQSKKDVNLLIDEVYIANCVEYQYGTFFGLTEVCARTVLTFLVQSLLQKLLVDSLSSDSRKTRN